MPLGRYLLFVGSALIALFFLTDAYLPQSAGSSYGRESRVDKSIIRLSSAHKWPEKVVYDTTLPTIVPPVSTAAETQRPILSASPREAFAKMAALPPVAVTPVNERTSGNPKRKLKRRPAAARIVAYRDPSYSWPASW